MIEASSFQWGVVIVASLGAAVSDVRTRRIPNVLTLPLAATGLAFAAWQGGWVGFRAAAVGCCVLALPYVLLFLLGGGAGDAKMMGAIGAWLGINVGLYVLLAVAAIGAAFGVLRILADRNAGTRLGGFFAGVYVFLLLALAGKKDWDLLRPEVTRTGSDEEREQDNTPATGGMMPYGPAIFLGVCCGALVVHLWNG